MPPANKKDKKHDNDTAFRVSESKLGKCFREKEILYNINRRADSV